MPYSQIPGRPRTRRAVNRTDLIDAAARVIARYGHAGLHWSQVAQEAGIADDAAIRGRQDLARLIDECYARTAQGLQHSLLMAETAPGTGLDRLAAFLVTALEMRRERGAFLSFRRAGDLPEAQQRRLLECELMIRARLRRLLVRGQRDGTLALRNPDGACDMILNCLQVPTAPVSGPEQTMWDSELTELLLAALAEPHAGEPVAHAPELPAQARGSCVCGTVRFSIGGGGERVPHGAGSRLPRLAVPASAFRWLAGEEWVTRYEAVPDGRRAFCSWCGSPAPVIAADTGLVLCPLESLEVGGAAAERSESGH